jgi:hypothetical protein
VKPGGNMDKRSLPAHGAQQLWRRSASFVSLVDTLFVAGRSLWLLSLYLLAARARGGETRTLSRSDSQVCQNSGSCIRIPFLLYFVRERFATLNQREDSGKALIQLRFCDYTQHLLAKHIAAR